MEVKYDKEAQAVYIKLIDTKRGRAGHTQELTDSVTIDWTEDGTLHGIEILNVDKVIGGGVVRDKGFRLEKRTTDKGSYYAALCLTMGFTAYGDNPDHAWDRLKKMFGILVDAQRDRGKVE